MRSIKKSIFVTAFLLTLSTIQVIAQTVEGPPSNTAPDVDSITLNRSVVYLECANPLGSPAECSDQKSQYVEVKTTVTDKENNVVTITYQVTAGRIVGQGPKVYWYLAGVKPDFHTITAIADDGGGPKGRRVTKEVEVKACSNCPPQ